MKMEEKLNIYVKLIYDQLIHNIVGNSTYIGDIITSIKMSELKTIYLDMFIDLTFCLSNGQPYKLGFFTSEQIDYIFCDQDCNFDSYIIRNVVDILRSIPIPYKVEDSFIKMY